jgi:hypothetical protein
LLYGDINLINTEIDLYHSIGREEIREVAKYLSQNQRFDLGLHSYYRNSSEFNYEKKQVFYSSIICNRNYASRKSQPKPGNPPVVNLKKPQTFS